jgi:hypothetical protein
MEGEGPFIGWCGPPENSSSVEAAKKFISDSISRWKAAFDPLWKRLELESQPIHLPAAILNIQVKYIGFDLLASSNDDQTVFDSHTDDFLEMIDLVQYVVDNSESKRCHFHLESQVVLPLCITALRCRDKDHSNESPLTDIEVSTSRGYFGWFISWSGDSMGSRA